MPKLPKFFSRKFSFHSTYLPQFLEFSVEWFAFRKFNSFRNFWKLFREISVPFAAVSTFSNGLVEWKAPLFSLLNSTRIRQKSIKDHNYQKRSQECECLEFLEILAYPEVNILHDTQLYKCKKDTSLASSVFTYTQNFSIIPSLVGSVIAPSDLLSDSFCVLNKQRLNNSGLLAISLAMCCSYGNLS